MKAHRCLDGSCSNIAAGWDKYCFDCKERRLVEARKRAETKRAYKRKLKAYARHVPLKTNGDFPPLADSDFPVFSRGWFKAQLAAGLTPEAMAAGSRRKLAYIKAELAWMPRRENAA